MCIYFNTACAISFYLEQFIPFRGLTYGKNESSYRYACQGDPICQTTPTFEVDTNDGGRRGEKESRPQTHANALAEEDLKMV